MKSPLVVVGALLVVGVPLMVSAQRPAAAPIGTVLVENCLVSLVNETEVPAEESGVLRELYVKEGAEVKETDLLAQIDDTRAQRQKEVADANLAAATKKAENRTNIEYAEASSKVAYAEWMQGEEANRMHKGTVTPAEIERLKLTYYKTWYEIKQAKMTKEIAGDEAKVSEAEVKAADEGIERRKIKSPWTGTVVEVYKNKGEWVQPGDLVMHVIRLDRLRIEGYLKMGQLHPREVKGLPVTVSIELERGVRREFQGKIVFANPTFESGGEYQVWAEVDNQRDQQGNWLLGPGLLANMTIHLK